MSSVTDHRRSPAPPGADAFPSLQPWLEAGRTQANGVRYQEWRFTLGDPLFPIVIWSLDGPRDAAPVDYCVFPDGCADVVFEGGSGRGYFSGTLTTPQTFRIGPGEQYVGVRLPCHVFAAVTRVPAGEIVDRFASMEDFLPRALPRLFDLARPRATFAENARCLASFVERRLGENTVDFRVREAVTALTTAPDTTVAQIAARSAGLCARQLRRVMHLHTGLPPKTLGRVLRFQRALREVLHGKLNLSAVAQAATYADQAHMNRDFLALSGYSPGHWRRMRMSVLFNPDPHGAANLGGDENERPVFSSPDNESGEDRRLLHAAL